MYSNQAFCGPWAKESAERVKTTPTAHFWVSRVFIASTRSATAAWRGGSSTSSSNQYAASSVAPRSRSRWTRCGRRIGTWRGVWRATHHSLEVDGPTAAAPSLWAEHWSKGAIASARLELCLRGGGRSAVA